MVPSRRKALIHRKFTAEEDKLLSALVEIHGTSNWIKIALFMDDRNSRQCRERWLNYLSPKLNKSEWTQEEDDLLLSLINDIGKHWVKITQCFPGRTDQMLKNRYSKITRNSIRSSIRKKKSQHKIKNVGSNNSKRDIMLAQNDINEEFLSTYGENNQFDLFDHEPNMFISDEFDINFADFEEYLSKHVEND